MQSAATETTCISYKDYVVTHEGERTGLRIKAECRRDALRKLSIASVDLDFSQEAVGVHEA